MNVGKILGLHHILVVVKGFYPRRRCGWHLPGDPARLPEPGYDFETSRLRISPIFPVMQNTAHSAADLDEMQIVMIGTHQNRFNGLVIFSISRYLSTVP